MNKCWQCHESLTEEDERQEYCGHCGIWLGVIVPNVVAIPDRWQELKRKIRDFRMIFKSPPFMWLDEFFHAFTNWHDKDGWVKKKCDEIEERLSIDWPDEKLDDEGV